MNNEINYTQIEKNFVDYILHISGPNKVTDSERNAKLQNIKKCIETALVNEMELYNIYIFSFGSFAFKSYHQNSDIDVTLLFEDKNTKKLLCPYTETFLNKVLDSIKDSISLHCQENKLEEHIEKIDAEVKLIKVKYESLNFDISFHNFPGLFKLIFMNHLENNYLNPIVYKKALLLIKSFFYYEANILGSNIAALGSYALEVMVIYIFNKYPERCTTELDSFFAFFDIMNNINWDKQILTIYGLLEQSAVNFNAPLEEALRTLPTDQKITFPKIEEYVKQFMRFNNIDKVQNFSINQKLLSISKTTYISDPIYPANNLTRSMNQNNFSRMKELFSYMTNKIEGIKKMKEKNSFNSIGEYFNLLLDIFHDRIISCNSELFRLHLPEPKIVIVSSKANEEQKKNDENSDLIQNFNKKFTLEDKDEDKIGENFSLIKNKINGFLWPSNEDYLDDFTVMYFYNTGCKLINNSHVVRDKQCCYVSGLCNSLN